MQMNSFIAIISTKNLWNQKKIPPSETTCCLIKNKNRKHFIYCGKDYIKIEIGEGRRGCSCCSQFQLQSAGLFVILNACQI